jgi:hypothetical protein
LAGMIPLSHMDRISVNADIRSRYGDVVTRQQLKDYQRETGTNAYWIRRGDGERVGRGTYRIPGSGSAPAVGVLREGVRPVISTPFDDELYSAKQSLPKERKDVGDKLVVANGNLHFHRCSCGHSWGCRRACASVGTSPLTSLSGTCRQCRKKGA